jgi:hypothetical protein
MTFAIRPPLCIKTSLSDILPYEAPINGISQLCLDAVRRYPIPLSSTSYTPAKSEPLSTASFTISVPEGRMRNKFFFPS